MTTDPLPRRARLLIVSTRHSPEELEERLGMSPDAAVHAIGPDEVSRRLHREENTWELHEEGTSDADITELIESLCARARPITGTLRELKDEGCAVILRLVLRLSPADHNGPGFAIGREIIEWLNEAGIEFIDVDQYIFES
jgi:hypothetical protein